MRFAFIAKHRGIWPVSWICETLGVSRSGFQLFHRSTRSITAHAQGQGESVRSTTWPATCSRSRGKQLAEPCGLNPKIPFRDEKLFSYLMPQSNRTVCNSSKRTECLR